MHLRYPKIQQIGIRPQDFLEYSHVSGVVSKY